MFICEHYKCPYATYYIGNSSGNSVDRPYLIEVLPIFYLRGFNCKEYWEPNKKVIPLEFV